MNKFIALAILAFALVGGMAVVTLDTQAALACDNPQC